MATFIMLKRRMLFTLAAVILMVGGVAYASIPDSGGVIHGCYKNGTGVRDFKLLDSDTGSCASGWTEITWNQTGPQGATGATGATGPQGASPTFYSVYVEKTFNANSTNVFGVACDSGDVAVGGEYNGVTAGSLLNITTSQFGGGGLWVFQVDNLDSSAHSAIFGVRCAG